MNARKNAVIAEIIWTRDDIRQLLEDHDLDSSEEAIDQFLTRLDVQYFEECCIQDGWERLGSILL